MVVGNRIVPGLQLVGARFLNFLLGKPSQEFKLCRMSIFHEIQMAIFGHAGSPARTVYVAMTLTRSKVKVKVTEHLNFRQLPITAHFCVYLLRHFRVELKTDG